MFSFCSRRALVRNSSFTSSRDMPSPNPSSSTTLRFTVCWVSQFFASADMRAVVGVKEGGVALSAKASRMMAWYSDRVMSR